MSGAATIILALAWSCYVAVGEEPFVCLPLALPTLPFAWIADIINFQYDAPTNWFVLLAGSFVVWFTIGAATGLGVAMTKKKKNPSV